MAPEIVGGERLQRIKKTISVGQQLSIYVPLGFGVVTIAWAVAFRTLDAKLHRITAAAIVSGVAVVVAVLAVQLIRRHVVQRFVEKLRDQDALRRQLLTTGAVLFTVGFLAQFASTFQ